MLTEDLPERLRKLRELLDEALGGGAGLPPATRAVAERAAERLDRDLLPRTAGAHDHLVVGIVGPNNAGKSALFNALVGRLLSPSEPTGGATRRLIGACHPELARHMRAEPTLARFALRAADPAQEPVTDALRDVEDASELMLVERDDLPTGILLIDTPDFDSILLDNRRVSEALLKVADLALVVVTRHTYQNRDVVDFLATWLAHGRPWLLVYNESLGPDVIKEHAAKLSADLESPPLAIFHAPFDIDVQRGERWLEPVALAAGGIEAETPLRAWLLNLGNALELKSRALESSLSALRDDVGQLRAAVAAEAQLAADVRAAARTPALELGGEVARKAMPMGPFLDAFRAVLDRRPSLVQRGLRGALRRTRLMLESAISKLPFSSKASPISDGDADLARIERKALEPAWPAFFELLCLELGRGGSFWKERDPPDEELAARLEVDLTPAASDPARARALERLGDDPEVLRAFQDACESLIDAELAERGDEWILQLVLDTLHLLPVVAASIVIFKTGGLGADIAVAGAGTFSTLVAEKMSKLLGSEVARGARRRWTRLRGSRLADVLVTAALARTSEELDARRDRNDQLGRELQRIREEAL